MTIGVHRRAGVRRKDDGAPAREIHGEIARYLTAQHDEAVEAVRRLAQAGARRTAQVDVLQSEAVEADGTVEGLVELGRRMDFAKHAPTLAQTSG